MVKALGYIAQQLEFKVHVIHVLRRSVVGDEIVDHLSKGEVLEVGRLRPGARESNIKCS